MTAVLIVILVIAAMTVVATICHRKKSAVRPASPRPLASSPPGMGATDGQPAPVAAAVPAAAITRSLAIPAELAQFRFIGRDDLSIKCRQALMIELRRVPRPPLSLYKLVSKEFLDGATSNEISALIMGEALIAAKVLARVNSPFYGLRRPVVSIGRAVSFIGLNAVRSICLTYMLDESFKASSHERKQIFERVMGASAMASELCFKLAHRLNLPDQGSLVTQVVLSFLGHLVAVSLMPLDCMVWTADNGLIERAGAEQMELGLAATEIGGLLMREWGLPMSLITEVEGIDRILVTPAQAIEPNRRTRLALCYLCARLGDRLSLGRLSDLATLDLATDSSAEFFHLWSYLDSPELARLPEFLRSAELVKSVQHMQLALRTRR